MCIKSGINRTKSAIAVALLCAVFSFSVMAQVGELRGQVFMERADGQKVPLADAQVDVFRTDISGKYNTKTNKKGEFVFAGLPYDGIYVVAISHPTATPNWVGDVKAGRDVTVELTLMPGDGKRLTYEEFYAGSPAAKAEREELARKNAEIEEGNRKIEERNRIISRTFAAGNEALRATVASSKANALDDAIRQFTEAVAYYDEGLTADPEQPAILTNKAVALKGRGVERFNAAIRSGTLDDAARDAELQQAKNDFQAAAAASAKSVALITAQSVPTDRAELQRYNGNRYAAMVSRAESMRLFVSKVDPTQADAGLIAYKEYIAIETDPAKKAKAQLDMAQMLLDASSFEKALAEFRAILATRPNSPEANLGAGLALYFAEDKSRLQEVANYLQHFVEAAPDSDPMLSDVKAILSELKQTEKITPQVTEPPRSRP
jgi:tetratricopeptide (TPR) repeat protein